eukprot:CAMPEP_0201194358 /NCGR_PEP_ID=MMETSP0851-20130426/148974_1 /ASSEMBLY_ACC=CAM_ASM_000631 /TAXON_ID=183588 /ORGANISM="Pseudo-nitzschia fraudulenta, Strain WWA7" /LENGTH=240 /DNA_ID=CAMNT_0047481021 /DNA_START=304 /DNA_END=1026 /DNA_ORIENTATION=+
MTIVSKTRGLRFGHMVVDGFAWKSRRSASTIVSTGQFKSAYCGLGSSLGNQSVYGIRSMALSSSTSSVDDLTSIGNSNRISDTRLFSEEINVLYDSKCNVCKLEMDWLVSRDVRLNGPDNRKLKLTDLEDNFDATNPANGGIDYDTGMAAIYAIRHDGEVFKGVPVFELAYDQVGLGWLWKLNNVPAINRFFNWGYEIFARNRTRITRGASLEELLRLNAEKKKAQEVAEDCESCNKKMM